MRAIFENAAIAVEDEDNVLAIAARTTNGYAAGDMQNVAEKAAHLAVSQSDSMADCRVTDEHLKAAVDGHIPFGLYGIDLKQPAENQKSWSDVGGLVEAKRVLMETLKWPTQVKQGTCILIKSI